MCDSSRASYLPAATVFTGSFMLFLMQPVMGRTLLPVFGGAASVWMICLASWQTLLLVGYFYAHCFGRISGGRRNIHIALLALSALTLLLVTFFKTNVLNFVQNSFAGSLGVFAGILVFAAFPYILLASGSTLVQAWLAGKGKDVYHLYAVSNAGSLCGLLCYPFLVEPFVPVGWQWLALVGMLLLYCAALKKLSSSHLKDEAPSEQSALPEKKDVNRWNWLLLPALSCFLLNAVIAHMFIDVTPLPLIWVFFISCFLLSYITGFSRVGGFLPKVWAVLAFLSVTAAVMVRGVVGTGSFLVNGAASAALLIFFGSWLHRRLFECRPEPARLTQYYLVITAGGAIGGLLASVVAPMIFKSVFEYPLALWLCAVLLIARLLNRFEVLRRRPPLINILLIIWAVLAFSFIRASGRRSGSRVIYAKRNFYGALRVTQTKESFDNKNFLPVNYLWSGQTTHGIQVKASSLQNKANAYYGETGGGIAIKAHPRYQEGLPLTVGVVGLGTGTMACYGRPGDLYRFYEINPAVLDVAGNRRFFTYLADSEAAIDLIEGDARRMLEVERAAGDPLYDSLIIDAYSGDAVPYHLATREAFELYFSRLKPDGILAMHVSNWHINLLPLCKAAARDCGAEPYGVVGVNEDALTSSAIWVFLTRTPLAWRYPMWLQVREVDWSKVRDIKLPKDDCGSLISLIRWL